ncbi:MAG TPA: sodium/proline symporter [Tenuifilaceae bacterium]|nr:sodium/proline symporter [Tenuifilaceae bacterium]HPE18573.1 sodium/proline symporter [Tenuifilaceae bacterium]HPJ46108.1 sodium/proline symporter [Tenuifilaceae bacterium]HPQ34407.1 sodium/proline symporter [Tenuifilaceae bacterium]HRX67803.1 sodium/proline symporter [Tenuifilaceae bacterium]
MDSQIQLAVVMFAYLSMLIIWGIYQGRKVKSDKDFAIAGRNLPGWVAALSERATGESSWALLGLPGAAYAMGLTEIWTALGCVFGIIAAWWLLSWRLRDEAEKYDANTFADYLARRHGDAGKMIRIVGSFTIVFFFFFYVGAQFLGGGKTLHAMFSIKPEWGMLVTALIIVPYAIYGGFTSVVYTDVVQALVMITTLVIGPIAGIYYITNNPDVFANSIPSALQMAGPGHLSLFNGLKGFAAGGVIVSGFSWFFGYLGGMPQLSLRFMAIKDMKQAKKARNVGIAWTLVAYVGAMLLGLIGLAIFGPGTLTDQEYVMPAVLLKIFPPAIAAVLITGAIAAMISTADSLLVLSATEMSENLVKPFSKKVDSRKGLRRSRVITALIAIVALGVAYVSPQKLIFTLVGYVWAGIGCTFSVVILFTLFWKRYHGRAVVTTIVAGLLFTILWISLGFDKTVITARVANFIFTLVVASLATIVIKPAANISRV